MNNSHFARTVIFPHLIQFVTRIPPDGESLPLNAGGAPASRREL